MKIEFDKKVGIASAYIHKKGIKVLTLLQNSSKKQPSINAFLGARYSRSSDSIYDIAKEIINNNTDAAARLESIFNGYGHKSVGDMADIFLCIENIPMITAMRLFYFNSVVSGQERSTRFQNFSKPRYIKLSKSICNDETVIQKYEEIIKKQINDYIYLLPKVYSKLSEYFNINLEDKKEVSALNARTFDTVRYLIPLGMYTNSAYLMSARNWAENIGYLASSKNSVDKDLSRIIFSLIGKSKYNTSGYLKEADGLISHTDPNYCRDCSTGEILSLFNTSKITNFKKSLTVSVKNDAVKEIISHYILLNNPNADINSVKFNDLVEIVGTKIFQNHDHHNTLGNIGQSGAIKIDGYASLGSLKDLNRHRSFERFIPFYHNECNLDNELNRENSDIYTLCEYLEIPEFKELRMEFINRLDNTYKMIKKWRKESKKFLNRDILDEYTKYLLPHGHKTRYVFYGSFDDLQYLINLRTRNGGHISYRILTYNWLVELSKKSNIFKPLLRKINKPDYFDRFQFTDRA